MTDSPSATGNPDPDFHAYPPDITFETLIRRNRRNSRLLIAGMGVLVVAVIVAIGIVVMIYGRGVITAEGLLLSAIAGLIVMALATLWSYYGGSRALLRISQARPIEKVDDPQLFNVVEEMSLAAGLPMPKVYLIDSPALNAFSTGRDPQHAAVAITTGLREQLTRDELAGVMAHEMAHVRHLDIRLTMLVATLVGLIVLLSHITFRAMFYGGAGRRRSSGGGKGKGGAAVMVVLAVIAIFLMVIAPLLGKLIQYAVSRQREHLADAGAVELTRYPKGLADALRKLSADTTPLPQANAATAHLYIVNPVLNAKGRENINSVFATHPPVRERIQRLEALMR